MSFLNRTRKEKYTLKKTEGAIKNGQFIETGNTGRRQTQQKHTAQKIKT